MPQGYFGSRLGIFLAAESTFVKKKLGKKMFFSFKTVYLLIFPLIVVKKRIKSCKITVVFEKFLHKNALNCRKNVRIVLNYPETYCTDISKTQNVESLRKKGEKLVKIEH